MFIQVDIPDFFNQINYEILIHLIRKEIDDLEFIDLIRKALKAGYLKEITHLPYSQKGIIQDGNLSSILSNIYLHELDCFLEE